MRFENRVTISGYRGFYNDELTTTGKNVIPALTFLLQYDKDECSYVFGKIDVLNNDEVRWYSIPIDVLRKDYDKTQKDACEYFKFFETATSEFVRAIIGTNVKQENVSLVLVPGSWQKANAFVAERNMELHYFDTVNSGGNDIDFLLGRDCLNDSDDNYSM